MKNFAKKVPFLLMLTTVLIFTACSGAKVATTNNETATVVATEVPIYHKLSAEEAKQKIDSGDALLIVDVRTEEEFKTGHIQDAILIPNETITIEQPTLLPEKNATILVYCRSGNRSKQAADKLVEMGYTQVYDFGGIVDWPYDTVK